MYTCIWDKKVKDLLDKSYKRAWDLLHNNRRDLERLATALLKHESLTGAEIKDILAGKAIRTETTSNLKTSNRGASSPSSGGGAAAKKAAAAAAAAATKAAASAAVTATTSAATRVTGPGGSGGGSEGGSAKGRLI